MGVFPKSILTIVMFSLLFSCNIEEGVNTNSIMDNNNQNESVRFELVYSTIQQYYLHQNLKFS